MFLSFQQIFDINFINIGDVIYYAIQRNLRQNIITNNKNENLTAYRVNKSKTNNINFHKSHNLSILSID